jgi:hypothetical protein
MAVRFHPHARERMGERGATEDEVRATVKQGEQFPAKFGRTGFRRNFPFDSSDTLSGNLFGKKPHRLST